MMRNNDSRLGVWTLVLCCVGGLVAMASEKPVTKNARQSEQLWGVRLVKQTVGLTGKTPQITFPGQERHCRLTGYQGENAQEYYFDVAARGVAPTACVVRVACEGLKLRTVWVGHTQVPFQPEGQAIRFALVGDARNPYAMHISLRDEPELLLYYMPKPPQRASGSYRDVPWPAAAAAAEVNLMFAARTAFQDMQLAAAAKAPHTGFDGYVAIGGFETTYPRTGRGPGGHVDFPPHIHLFLVVPPGWRIRQASHLYLDDQGRLTGNIHCSPSACKDPAREYSPGEWCQQCDMADRLGFEFQIDREGGVVLRRPGSQYRLCPDASRSFRNGCLIEKAGRPWCRVVATDDTDHGVLRIVREPVAGATTPVRQEETIRYDPNTAAILGRAKS
jgi:hypothetical protein